MYHYYYKPGELYVDVLRKFDEYETIPTEEEIRAEIGDYEEGMADGSNWERHLEPGIRVTHPPGYGSKGNW